MAKARIINWGLPVVVAGLLAYAVSVAAAEQQPGTVTIDASAVAAGIACVALALAVVRRSGASAAEQAVTAERVAVLKADAERHAETCAAVDRLAVSVGELKTRLVTVESGLGGVQAALQRRQTDTFEVLQALNDRIKIVEGQGEKP